MRDQRLNAGPDELEVGEGFISGGRRERVLEGLGRGGVIISTPAPGAHVPGHQLVPRVGEILLKGSNIIRVKVDEFLVFWILLVYNIARDRASVSQLRFFNVTPYLSVSLSLLSIKYALIH